MTTLSNTFHLSNRGSDNALGTTPESPWATIARVQRAIDDGELGRGDTVLFHAGHRFHGQFTDFAALQGEGRLTFGAYGVGERPRIVGYKVLNKPSAWRNLGGDHWQLQLDDLDTHDGNHSTRDVNVGLLRVGDELLGGRRPHRDELREDWDWCCDPDAGTLTIHSRGNPSGRGEVQVAVDGRIFLLGDDMGVEGLELMGCGGHGVQVIDARRVRVLDNRIHQIGGSELIGFDPPGTRYGNGVEVWINSHDVLVAGNLIHDVYDVAVTLQGEQVVTTTEQDPVIRHGWSEVHVRDNRISRCSQSFEIWSRGQGIRDEAGKVIRELLHLGEGAGYLNCSFVGNHCSDAGVGWGYDARPNKDEGGVHLLSYSEDLPMGLVITGNVFHDAVNAYIYRLPEEPSGLVVDHNEIRLRPGQRIQQQRPEALPDHRTWSGITGLDQHSTWLGAGEAAADPGR